MSEASPQRPTAVPHVPEPSGSPVVDGHRVEIEELRADVGDTVDELARRLDVPTRVKERRAEVTAQAQARITHAWGVAAERVPALQRTAPPSPQVVAAAVAAVVVAVTVALRARRR